jgi:hypothetical protein
MVDGISYHYLPAMKKGKARNINRAIDSVNRRYGKKGIIPGRLLKD